MAVRRLRESLEDDSKRTLNEITRLIADLNEKEHLFSRSEDVFTASLYNSEVFERCEYIRSYLNKIFDNIAAIEYIVDKEDY